MDQGGFDAIVIGSGIGGLAAGAALSKQRRRVLVLEQHVQLGGLTQTFERNGYTFSTGLHYIGGLAEADSSDGQFGSLLRWLTDGDLRFASIGSPYDIVRLPGLEFPIESPRAAYVARLKQTFPAEAEAIDAYFRACDGAQSAAMALFVENALPAVVGDVLHWFNARKIDRAVDRSWPMR